MILILPTQRKTITTKKTNITCFHGKKLNHIRHSECLLINIEAVVELFGAAINFLNIDKMIAASVEQIPEALLTLQSPRSCASVQRTLADRAFAAIAEQSDTYIERPVH